jgi:hypothetical protein
MLLDQPTIPAIPPVTPLFVCHGNFSRDVFTFDGPKYPGLEARGVAVSQAAGGCAG